MKIKKSWTLPLTIIGIFISVIALIGYFSFALSLKQKEGWYGVVGDAIGGIMSPIIGLIGAVLVFVSFNEQRKANDIILKSQREGSINEYLRKYLSEVTVVLRDMTKESGMVKVQDTLSKVCKSAKVINDNLKNIKIVNNLVISKLDFSNLTNDALVINSNTNRTVLRNLVYLLKHVNFFLRHLNKLLLDESVNKDTIKLYFDELDFIMETSFISNIKTILETKFDLKESPIYDDLNDVKIAATEFLNRFDEVKRKVN